MVTKFLVQIDHLPDQIPQMDKLVDAILEHVVLDASEVQVQVKDVSTVPDA